ncbi:MAG: hypothetical protein ACM3NO_06205 [Deltaproteobacteria bacterium]
MTPSRKQPGVAFWATVVVVVTILAYPLSFGPACWITSRTNFGPSAIASAFWPMTVASSRFERVRHALNWYARLGAANGWNWGFAPYAAPQGKGTVTICFRWAWRHLDPP